MRPARPHPLRSDRAQPRRIGAETAGNPRPESARTGVRRFDCQYTLQRKRRDVWLASLLCLLAIGPASAIDIATGETITGAEILELSANLSCLAYRPVGFCVWMTCTPFGCEFETSTKVRHYTPDAVVTAYHVTGKSPWLETRRYARPNARAQDGGTNSEGSTTINETALRFKEADVIGSPGTLWIEALSSTQYLCDPIATPYRPYFLSALDWAWRDSTLETPLTIRNLHRSLRTLVPVLSSWGPIFPRVGFVHQGHDYKAGALVAQRAADLVTRHFQPHFYWPLRAQRSRQGQWPPGPVKEGSAETHRWQQLIPKAQADHCRVWPDIGDQQYGAIDPFQARLSPNTGYAFNLWRPYRCCEQRGQVLVFHIGE